MITIKTKEDIAILREGGRRHGTILRELAKMVKPGVLAQDIENRTRELIAEGGDQPAVLNFTPHGSARPFPAALCLSINDEIVHGIPNEGNKILKEGDIVTLDLGLIHKGLFTDAAITVPVGKISSQKTYLLEKTREALLTGIKAAKGGKKIGDIGNAIERTAISSGLGINYEFVGHGVGYAIHEDPYVPNYGDAGKGPVLQPGMVIAIEPIFCLGDNEAKLDADGYTYRTVDGSPTAHFEHTVLITKGDPEILTA